MKRKDEYIKRQRKYILCIMGCCYIFSGCSNKDKQENIIQEPKVEEYEEKKESLIDSSDSEGLEKQSTKRHDIRWDITNIYKSVEDYENDIHTAEKLIESLGVMKGTLNTMDGIVRYYEVSDEFYGVISRLEAYATLLVEENQGDSDAKAVLGHIRILNETMTRETAFALPELFRNDKDFLNDIIKEERMKPYVTRYQREYTEQSHRLTEENERIILPIYRLQEGAVDLFDSLTGNDLVFPSILFPEGTIKRADDINYSLVINGDYTQEFRMEYYNAMMGVYHQYRNTFAQNLNNYYTALSQISSIRKYSSSLEADLAPGNTPIELYTDIITAAKNANTIVEKYLNLIREKLTIEQVYNFDTNVSIVETKNEIYSYDVAREYIEGALQVLGKDYLNKLGFILDGNYIDVYPREGKSSGGFAINVPERNPYILLNYNDTYDSMSTLAHELGHGVHMIYAGEQESYYNRQVTSLSSEVASTLNEILLSDYMIKQAGTQEEKKVYAARQLATLYSTFFTQTFFAHFQEKMANAVEQGETLTADYLKDLWLEVTKECYGMSYSTTNYYDSGWARIPHFYSGFYVYQYAVGIAAACNIAERIQSGDEGAVEDYINFLKAGDNDNVVGVLAIAGVNVRDGDYIKPLMKRFESLMELLQ